MSNTTTLSQDDKIRSDVSKTYTKALKQETASRCCGTAAPKTDALPVNVRGNGYTAADLTTVPQDAVTNSFGCGNPLAFAGVREGDTVVDLGSGAGIDLLIAAKKVGPRGNVIGIDMTDAMIEHARRNIRAAGVSNVEVRKGVIEKLPVEAGSVDWVISNCVINLSPDKPAVFREIARVLKPGGQMSVSDIVAERLPWWARKSMKLYASCVGGAISEAKYLDGLRAAGLVDVEVKDRLIYTTEQIQSVAEEIFAASPVFKRIVGFLIKPLSRQFGGKIWSAKVYARKPE